MNVNVKDKILIVEDESEIANILEEIIISQGYECLKLSNGLDGLIYIGNHQEHISLILSDITMPDMTGLEMISAGMQQHGFLPIVLITGHADFEFTQNAIQLGILDYILKPFDIAHIIKKLPVWIELGRRERDKFNGVAISKISNKVETLLRLNNTNKK